MNPWVSLGSSHYLDTLQTAALSNFTVYRDKYQYDQIIIFPKMLTYSFKAGMLNLLSFEIPNSVHEGVPSEVLVLVQQLYFSAFALPLGGDLR